METKDIEKAEYPETKGIAPELAEAMKINRVMIGTVVKNYLEANNLTVTALAEASGISREQIGWIITGKRDPRLSTVLRLFAVMKYSVLFEEEE